VAAEDLLGREEAHVARMEQSSAQLDGLVGKEPRETLPKLRDGAALEIEQKTSALEALGPIAKEPRARERLEVEVRDQEATLDRARDDEANARARVENNTVDAEQVAAEAERLTVWREQLAVLLRRHRVLDATLRAIERAETATMKTATRYLEGTMNRDVSTVTGGRYRRSGSTTSRSTSTSMRPSAATGCRSATSARAPWISSTSRPDSASSDS
jgi:hypothetical protein